MLAFQGSIIWSWGSFRFTCVKSCKGFINFCRVSCVMAIKIANKDSSIYDESQEHSSFWLLQRAAYHHYHGLFIGKRPSIFWLEIWPWMSPLLWRQFRSTGVGQDFASTVSPWSKYCAIKTIWFCTEIFKYDIQLLNIDTVEQFETSLQKILSPKLFLNISARKPWDDNSLHSLIKIQALNIRFQSREGVLY